MFIFPAQVMLTELKTHAPDLIKPIMEKGVDAYQNLEKLSIDYAVMGKKTDRSYVMPVSFGWDDLGDWNAVERLLKQPDDKNVDLATHVAMDTEGSIVYSSDQDEVIVTIGLEDVVVVRDGNATLIVRKDRTQDIKKGGEAAGPVRSDLSTCFDGRANIHNPSILVESGLEVAGTLVVPIGGNVLCNGTAKQVESADLEVPQAGLVGPVGQFLGSNKFTPVVDTLGNLAEQVFQ